MLGCRGAGERKAANDVRSKKLKGYWEQPYLCQPVNWNSEWENELEKLLRMIQKVYSHKNKSSSRKHGAYEVFTSKFYHKAKE